MYGDASPSHHHGGADQPAHHPIGDPNAPAPARRRRVSASAILAGGVSLLLVGGLVAAGCSAKQDATATGNVVSSGGTAGTTPGGTARIGGGIGSLVPDPDHPGQLIQLDDITTTTSPTGGANGGPNVTATVAPTVPPTAPPTTTAPTTAPPTTAPPTTKPPTTTTTMPTTTTTKATTTPTINWAVNPAVVNCPSQSSVHISWTTGNAVKVILAIGNENSEVVPGPFQTYGPNGEADLPFNCDAGHQRYWITAVASDGGTTSQHLDRKAIPNQP